MNMTNDIIAYLGYKKELKLGVFKKLKFVYCGMPCSDVFSISHMEENGYQGYGLNIFYPKKTKKITIGEIEFDVVNVNTGMITLRPILKRK